MCYKIRNKTCDLFFSWGSEKFWGGDESPETLISGLDVILLNKCESAELVLVFSSTVGGRQEAAGLDLTQPLRTYLPTR